MGCIFLFRAKEKANGAFAIGHTKNQLIAIHLLATGVKASLISKQLGIREETLSL